MPARADTVRADSMRKMPARDTAMSMPGMAMPGMAHAGHDMAAMMDGPLGISHARMGSGTSWLPDSSPMHATHKMWGDWTAMIHGVAFAQYDNQGSKRGDSQFGIIDWEMLMLMRHIGTGMLHLHGMASLEPATIGAKGYPLLLQTGESYKGEPLHDRQHPHDFVMELAALFQQPIASNLALELYGGLAGEPALGPVAFMHRPSAQNDPLSPLGHHWQDATHISYGVLTAGVYSRLWKLEGSWFNGREPDEDRFDIELRGFDSYAARLSVAPHRDVSLQASYGYLASPEQLEPDVSVQRATTSATYNRPTGEHGNWASTAAWGRNIPDDGPSTDAFFVESAFDTGRGGTPFLRLELVNKAGHDLGFEGAMSEDVFMVHGATAGYLYELPALGELRPGLGAVGTLTHLPDDALAGMYGDSTLFGAMAYVTVRPTMPKPAHH